MRQQGDASSLSVATTVYRHLASSATTARRIRGIVATTGDRHLSSSAIAERRPRGQCGNNSVRHLASSATAERRLRGHRGNNSVSTLILLCNSRETPPRSSWQQQSIATYSPLQQQRDASADIVATTVYRHLFSSATAERRLRGHRGNNSASPLILLCNSRETPPRPSRQQQCIAA